MSFTISRYQTAQADAWNRFVEQANGGTLFHRVDFLAYHGERFAAHEHHLVIYNGQTLYGVMPMAIFEQDGRRIAKSPYGGSYGGPVFEHPQSYQESHDIIAAILTYLKSHHVIEFDLTLPIAACHRRFCETFRLALFEHGFLCRDRDISSVVYMDRTISVTETMTSRGRRMARKAGKLGVTVTHRAPLDDFWPVMEKTFAKHGSKPTHSRAEFDWLLQHHPDRVYTDVAYSNGEPVGGIGYFVINERVNSSFYLCQDPDQQDAQGLSLLVCQGLEQAQQHGFRWFDFGTASVNMKGRPNIFSFKESFGAVGQFRETYHWRDASHDARNGHVSIDDRTSPVA
jgi:hypothetical protein